VFRAKSIKLPIQNGATAMNDQTEHLEQTNQEILAGSVSDEALEAAASTQSAVATCYSTNICTPDPRPGS
jgi:hypothetical protein